jgi:hypothetical protein
MHYDAYASDDTWSAAQAREKVLLIPTLSIAPLKQPVTSHETMVRVLQRVMCDVRRDCLSCRPAKQTLAPSPATASGHTVPAVIDAA